MRYPHAAIFAAITDEKEYYLTHTEERLLATHGHDVVDHLRSCPGGPVEEVLNVVELGAGDGRKTLLLLNAITVADVDFSYIPIDISRGAMMELFKVVGTGFGNSLKMHGIVGDYLEALKWVVRKWPERRMLVLFLGSTIGNFTHDCAMTFLTNVRSSLKTRDLLLAGFDLKKDPAVMLRAYSDSKGLTRDFNMNLLLRLNREVNASFDTSFFRHLALYNPVRGAMESYLVALKEHDVMISDNIVHFNCGEAILTEFSYKYVPEQAVGMVQNAGFKSVANFYGFADTSSETFAGVQNEPWFLEALFEV